MKKNCGFTLLEILIALLIFSILAMISIMAMRSAIVNYQHVRQHLQRWQRIANVHLLFQNDFSQIVDRNITTGQDSVEPAVTSMNHNGIAFTRDGDLHPFSHQRHSSLIRVAYLLKKHTLYRITWPRLDRWPQSKTTRTAILHHVKHMQLQYVDNHNQFSNAWPYAMGSNALSTNNHSDLPKAINVIITLPTQGHIHWLFPIFARGQYAR